MEAQENAVDQQHQYRMLQAFLEEQFGDLRSRMVTQEQRITHLELLGSRATTPVVLEQQETTVETLNRKDGIWRGNIAPFHGYIDERIADFVVEADGQFVIHEIYSDVRKIEIVGTYLRSAAKSWFQDTRESANNWHGKWESLKSALLDEFSDEYEPTRVRERMASLKQSARAALSEYINGFKDLVRRVPDMSQADRVSNFTKGLLPETRKHVRLHVPTTLTDAINLAVNFDNSMRADGSGQFMSRPVRSANTPTPMELGRMESPLCFNCGKYGHIARSCRSSSNPALVNERRRSPTASNGTTQARPRLNEMEVVEQAGNAGQQ